LDLGLKTTHLAHNGGGVTNHIFGYFAGFQEPDPILVLLIGALVMLDLSVALVRTQCTRDLVGVLIALEGSIQVHTLFVLLEDFLAAPTLQPRVDAGQGRLDCLLV
jgi:hypothetical protein